MPERQGWRVAIDRVTSNPVGFIADATYRSGANPAPYTTYILLGVIFVFVLELSLVVISGADTVYQLASYVFAYHPLLAWPVAPFVHYGVKHFAANVVGLYIAAPVEGTLSKGQYLGLVVLAGFLPVYADGAKLFYLGSEPHVAAYGASGIVFGLLGCGLASRIGSEWRLTARWWLIVFLAGAAILAVGWNMIVAALGDPISLNLGHLGGLLAGLAIGYLARPEAFDS